MPSSLHEALADFVADNPGILGLLAPHLAELGLRPEGEFGREQADFSDLMPASLFADAVVRVDDAPGGPIDVVFEVQLSRDAHKPAAWLAYAARNHRRRAAPTEVVVITVSDPVAEWARTPLRWSPRHTYSPVVIGPADLRCPADLDAIARRPQIAVLMATCQPNNANLAPAIAVAIAAIAELPQPQRTLSFNLIHDGIGRALRRLAEELMDQQAIDTWKRHVPEWYPQLRQELVDEGRQIGVEQGRRALLDAVDEVLSPEQREHAASIVALDELRAYVASVLRPAP